MRNDITNLKPLPKTNYYDDINDFAKIIIFIPIMTPCVKTRKVCLF
jgi:hypothetical protein